MRAHGRKKKSDSCFRIVNNIRNTLDGSVPGNVPFARVSRSEHVPRARTRYFEVIGVIV